MPRNDTTTSKLTPEERAELRPTKHTPGPWRVEPYGSNQDLIVAPSYIGGLNGATVVQSIAEVDRSLGDIEGPCPNARLIAAAPELLEALRDVRVHLRDRQYEMADQAARTAIAKAEGR